MTYLFKFNTPRINHVTFAFSAVLSILLVGCGGNSSSTPNLNTSVLSGPPPAAAPINPAVTISDSRNNYEVKRTPSGFVVHAKNSLGVMNTLTPSAPVVRFNDFIINVQVGDKSKTIPIETLNSIIELYIAFFNRVPDANGLSYWIDQTKAGMSLDSMANSFYAAALVYGDITKYSDTMSNADFVRIVYKNVLGRNEVDAEGLAYWTAALSKPAGTSGAESRGTLIRTIVNTAHRYKGDAQYGWVANLLDNKIDVGTYVAIQHGVNFLTEAASITNGVAIAAAVTPTDTNAAKNLVGITDKTFDLRSTTAATIVNMKTSLGDIGIELDATKAPITVTNFLRYVDIGFYSNKIFHRVISTFMIQGGGFTADLVQASTYPPIKLEANNGLSNLRGTIAMARTNVLDSATSQFFINVVDNRGLDANVNSSGGYAVFGQVISGLDVVDKIRVVPTTTRNGYADVPVTTVTITSVSRVN